MKRILFFLSTILITLLLNAQEELRIKSFLPSINDLTARTNLRKDFSGKPCALVKVSIADSGVTFECGNIASMIVGEIAFHTNEYWVYLVAGAHGAKHLKVKHPKYPTVDVVFSDYGFSSLEPQMTYSLIILKPHKESKFKKTSSYFQPYGQIGASTYMGGSIGAFFHNFNCDVNYAVGLSESDEIFWVSSDNTGSSDSYSYIYKPCKFGAKIGYGLLVGERFRLTPQVGIGIVSITGKEVSIGEDNPKAKNGYATDLDVCLRSDIYISKHFCLSVMPEYSLDLNKSDLFNRISKVSSQVERFCSGLNLRFGLTFSI